MGSGILKLMLNSCFWFNKTGFENEIYDNLAQIVATSKEEKLFPKLFCKENIITHSLLHTLFEIVFSKHNCSSCGSVCMMSVQ